MYKPLFISALVLCASCTNNQTTSSITDLTHESKRIELANDTSFNFWDSLLLKFNYHPNERNLTAYDKEWYVFYDSAQLYCGYINMRGDTVIPMKYGYIPYVTDTFRSFAYVWLPNRGLVAINKKEQVLFEPYYFDTAPDELNEGLMRITRNEKVGFADKDGTIIIEPVYDVASTFEKGHAWVGFNCYREILYDEHNPTICRQNGIIDKKGKLLLISTNKDSVSQVYNKMVGRE
jgi:hypothetical protein